MRKVSLLSLFILLFSIIPLWSNGNSYSNCYFFLKDNSHVKNHFFSCIQTLNCDWEFYWNKTPALVQQLVDDGIEPDTTIKVPSYWNDTVSYLTGKKSPFGSGSYRIVVENLTPNTKYGIMINESPSTSAAIYVDRQIIYTCGDPFGISSEKSHSIIKPIYAHFISNETGTAEIIIYVTNYFYRIGGIWTPVQMGPNDEVFKYYNVMAGSYLISLGVLIFMSLLNLIQFFLNRTQKQYLFLFFITFASITRVSVAGFNTLNMFIPGLSAEIKTKIEFIAIWVIPFVYYRLITYLYPSRSFKNIKLKPSNFIRHTYLSFAFVIGILSLVLPPYQSTKTVPYLQVTAFSGAFLGLLIVITNLFKRKKYCLFHLLGIFFLLGGFVIDMLFENNKEVLKISYMPMFFALFSLTLIAMLSKIQNDNFKESEDLTNDLQTTNLSYIRFVPLEFLSMLKKDSITKIELGDHTNVEMSILYSKISIFDIKNSRIPDSDQQYKIFCEYLRMISPFITRHNGFISKFLSGGIIALFPGIDTADDALYASLKMVEALRQLNNKYEPEGIQVNVFTGVHYGKMILGTIGDATRLDDTVISDTVNTVSRIESVCERLNKNVIISEDLQKITAPQTPEVVNFTQLQPIQIKGKSKTLQLVACEAKSDFYEQPELDFHVEEAVLGELEEI